MRQNQEDRMIVGSTYRQTLTTEMIIICKSDTCFHCLDFLLQPPWECRQQSWTSGNMQSAHHCPLGLLQTGDRVDIYRKIVCFKIILISIFSLFYLWRLQCWLFPMIYSKSYLSVQRQSLMVLITMYLYDGLSTRVLYRFPNKCSSLMIYKSLHVDSRIKYNLPSPGDMSMPPEPLGVLPARSFSMEPTSLPGLGLSSCSYDS